jgi:PAS domain S-box-containing protein
MSGRRTTTPQEVGRLDGVEQSRAAVGVDRPSLETVDTTRPAAVEVGLIADHKRLEQELRATEARNCEALILLEAATAAQATLAAIVESSDDAIISTTLNRDILTWNRSTTALYGYEAADVIARNVSFLLPSERIEEMDGILRRITAGQDVRHLETVRIRKDGSRVPVPVAVWPLRTAMAN